MKLVTAALAIVFGVGSEKWPLNNSQYRCSSIRRRLQSMTILACLEEAMYALAVGHTDQGLVRDNNQDVIHIDNDLGLYVVCDGMGGHAAGDVAARTAVRVTASRVAKHRALIERARDGEEPLDTVVKAVVEAVQAACAEVFNVATARSECAGMGSTLTLFLAAGKQGIMAHVGDTRLYLVRDGDVNRLSVDHTMVEELVRAGVLSQEKAEDSPFASALTRALGTQPAVSVETLVFDLIPNDRLVLCSDGFSRYLSEDTDLDALFLGDIEELPETLVRFAKDKGGRDNISVIAVDISAEAEGRNVGKALGDDVQSALDALCTAFLFRDLALPQLLRVLNICENEQYDASTPIIQQGHQADRYWVVVKGRVAVSTQGGPTTHLADGDSFGEGNLVLEEPSRFSAVALEPTTLLSLETSRFRQFTRRRPWLGVTLLERIAQRGFTRST